jgi:hypothetical protein
MAPAAQTIDRQAMQGSNAPMLIQAAFSANDKDVVSAPDARGQVLLVAQVDSILREEPSRNPQLFMQARTAVDKMISDDMLLSLQSAATARVNVKTNQKMVDSALGVEAPAGGAPVTQ